MTTTLRVLHVLQAEEGRPPPVLEQAAGYLYALPISQVREDLVREHDIDVATLYGKIQPRTLEAVEQLIALRLSILGIGTGASEFLTTHVTADITSEDLLTVLDLLAIHTGIARSSVATCALQDTGECQGGSLDCIVRMQEHLMGLRVPEYHRRAKRVFEACLWMANHHQFTKQQVRELLYAARLREIGKLGLPDSILFSRNDQRTEKDWSAYNQYPVLGARVLAELPALRGVAKIVEHQLENFDGSGPANLSAHQIPFAARILRVAAAFSMVQDEDESQHSAHDALDVLERGKGSLFDPLLVRLMENLATRHEGKSVAVSTRRVRFSDLHEGMVLAEDLWSRTGMKLISRGTYLNSHLMKMLHHFLLDPSTEYIEVEGSS